MSTLKIPDIIFLNMSVDFLIKNIIYTRNIAIIPIVTVVKNKQVGFGISIYN